MKRIILFIIAATMLLSGCKKYIDYSAMKFEITNEEFVVTSTTATLTADYSWPGDIVSIAMEVSEDEGFANANSFEASVSGNSLTVTANGLKAETKYYYRMRLNMEDGKVESETKTLRTTAYILPTVTTSEVTNISGTKADCRCNVTSEGDFTVTARGVCWSTADNPTIDDSHTVDGGGAGSFISNITGLTGSTTYYVRAYVTSSAGTVYGETKVFVTTEYIFPTVTTSEVNYISATTAKCGGEVTEGDFTVTARGVCWSTADNPTIDDSHTVDGGGAGAFTSNITGLTENTTYYVRAYATCNAGTVYGATRTFKTAAYILPTVTTSEVTNIGNTTAECGGEVTEGDYTVTARGVCWSTADNPTIDDSHTVDGSGAGAFISNITGLTENTTYYVRAYATSSAGTVYGETRTFETFKTILSLTVNGISLEMVYVEGGTFDMGATTEQWSDAYDNEYPVHSVTLSGYYIGKCEVTQELWEAVMGSNPSYYAGAHNPVEQVNWNDCQEFVSSLNSLTGRTFRLPTEAEWEYAARGGNQSLHYKYSGSDNIGNVAWYNDNSGYGTHAVGTKSPNELGVYDMSGNVWEWCSDWYGGYSAGAQTNPQGPSSGSNRVRRGGSWIDRAGNCRVSNRDYYGPGYNSCSLNGLRLVLVP